MKIKKEEKEAKQVEGYIDNEKRVFVVTNDNGLLTPYEPEKTTEEYQDVKELFKKYKPEWMK